MKKTELVALGFLSALCVTSSSAVADATDGVETLALQAAPSLVGTWASKVSTTADLTVPLAGANPSKVELTLKLNVAATAGGQVSADVQICGLSTDSPNLKVDYSKLLPYLKTSISIPAAGATLGGKLALPDLVFRVGQDAAGASVDTDGDKNPGATLPVVALGILTINSYTGLDLNFKLDANWTDADTISGNGVFSGTGKVFGSNNPLLTGGTISVVQTKVPQPFAAKRVAGDPSCADLAKLAL
jgi:hypothetical protein